MSTPQTQNKAEDKANNTTFSKPQAAEVKKEIPKLSFPREFSHTVVLKRKKTGPPLPVEGEFIDESIQKVGPSWNGKVILRGLTIEEEARWLPNIIGLGASSPNWEKETKDYWANIGRSVPPNNKDGSGGLTLEVGLKYKNEADYKADQERTRDENGVIINPLGEPINLPDYVFWRFCLLHGKVANNYDLINKSAKIEFYLFSKEKELKDKTKIMLLKKDANQLFYQRMHERDWVENMLRLLIQQDPAAEYGVKDVPTIALEEQELLLNKYAEEYPQLFIAYGKDKHLEMKSFVEVCIAQGLLTRIPNTTSISMDGTTIGGTLDQTVTFLNDPANARALQQLKAQSLTRP